MGSGHSQVVTAALEPLTLGGGFVLQTSRDKENPGRSSCLQPKNLKYVFFPERDLENHRWSPAREKESALFGHSPFSSMASEQTVMASNKLSGPVHS